MKREPFTEAQAIRALHALAARWPSTLGLVKHTDSPALSVVRIGHGQLYTDDPAGIPALASVLLRVEVCA